MQSTEERCGAGLAEDGPKLLAAEARSEPRHSQPPAAFRPALGWQYSAGFGEACRLRRRARLRGDGQMTRPRLGERWTQAEGPSGGLATATKARRRQAAAEL